MSQDQQTYHRAVSASLLGLGVQLLAALTLLIVGLWTSSQAVLIAAWYAFGGLPVWVILYLVYQQHKLERVEALEAEQLASRHGTDSSLFETSAADLSVARRRLERLQRWGLPITSLLTAGYLMGVGGWLLSRAMEGLNEAAAVEVSSPLMALAFVAGLAFAGFLVSRYHAGLAKIREWQMLRGGAGFLMGICLIALTLTAGFALYAGAENAVILKYLTVILPIFMILVGVEIVMNFVLGIYRPRRPGEMPRPAFDSRLLGLLTSPESIASTITEAINYQFGFEITRSWFWQLLGRATLPLVIFALIVLLLLSTIVIVQPHQQAVVTRFGKLAGEPVGPGIHLKMPWPISTVERFDVTAVRELAVGSTREIKRGVPILWSNEHAEESEGLLIVAPPQDLAVARAQQEATTEAEREVTNAGRAPSVSLVSAEITVQYQIDDLMAYIRQNTEPVEQLQNIAESEVARYMLAHDVDQLVGPQRAAVGFELHKRIQAAEDQVDLGLKILFVAVPSIHPPQQVADAFHETVGADQEKQTNIEHARRQAIQTLAEVAGTTNLAERIVQEISQLERIDRSAVPEEELTDREARVEQLLRDAGGRAAELIAEARAYRWQRENSERGKAERFTRELLAYEQAPELYRMRRYLEVVSNALQEPRKYLLVADRKNLVLRFDFKDVRDAFQGLNLTAQE